MGFSMRVVVGACFLFVGVVRSDEAPRVVTDTEEGSLAWLEDEAVDATLLDLEGAARAGDPRAHHKLGEASLHGAGSRPQDFRAAAGHFIASGFPESLHAASRALAKAGDLIGAGKWLVKAADAGSEEAKARLARARDRQSLQPKGGVAAPPSHESLSAILGAPKPSVAPSSKPDFPAPSVKPKFAEAARGEL